jgi:DNA gyrase/topoisomerase IV subunit A
MQYFNIKKLFSDTKKVIIIVTCALLLIGNIVAFAYVGSATMMPTFLVVILSNIITILITFAIYKPINRIIEEEVQTRIKDENNAQMKLLEEKNELEQQKKYLEDVAAQREQKIKALQSELDTVRSYKSLSADTNTVLKLETMEYEKEGYIVKEEFVRDTEFGRDIKQDSKWNFMKDDKGEQKILYIKKFHEKAIIGIDIAKIRFCRHDGYIYLEGVKVENLHQEMTIRSGDGDGMERCMILNVDNGDIKGINNADKYNWFKQEYSIRQSDLLDFNFNQEVRSICASYTDVIKHNLSTKFPSVRFVDDKIEHAIDLAGEPIYQLNASNDLNILEVSSSIVLIANTIHQTMPAVAKF